METTNPVLPSRPRSSQQTASNQTTNSPPVFTLQILPSPSQNFLPALLGLDTLSLSLPSSRNLSSPGSDVSGQISKIVIRNIPAQRVHLLFSSAGLETGVRSGFWVYVPGEHEDGSGSGGEVVVSVRWDGEMEELKICNDDELLRSGVVVMRGSRTDVKTFDYRRLLAVKAGSRDGVEDGAEVDDREWEVLTRYVTPVLLDRISPPPAVSVLEQKKKNRIRTWPISTLSTSQATDDDLLEPQGHQSDEEETLHLTPISFTRTFPTSAIGAERTKWARDRSWYLSSLIDKPQDTNPIPTGAKDPEASPSSPQPYGATLLSELSFSFLTSHLLGNYTSQSQWKHILALALTCRAALSDTNRYTFFTSLLEILAPQIVYMTTEQQDTKNDTPGDTLDDTEPEISELKSLLYTFATNTLLEPSNTGIKAVQTALQHLNTRLSAAGLHWHLPTTNSTTNTTPSQTQPLQSSNLGLGRRILRIKEGFGDDVDGDDADGGMLEDGGVDEDVDVDVDMDGEEEVGEYAPVVVDLEGVLGGGGGRLGLGCGYARGH